jgi:hypothetical protein
MNAALQDLELDPVEVGGMRHAHRVQQRPGS